MQKFFKEKYDEKQLKIILKMNKLLNDSYQEFINRKNSNEDKNIEDKKKINKKILYDELYEKLDEMYNLSSLFDRERIMNIITRNDGNEENVMKEIELMLWEIGMDIIISFSTIYYVFILSILIKIIII